MFVDLQRVLKSLMRKALQMLLGWSLSIGIMMVRREVTWTNESSFRLQKWAWQGSRCWKTTINRKINNIFYITMWVMWQIVCWFDSQTVLVRCLTGLATELTGKHARRRCSTLGTSKISCFFRLERKPRPTNNYSKWLELCQYISCMQFYVRWGYYLYSSKYNCIVHTLIVSRTMFFHIQPFLQVFLTLLDLWLMIWLS